MLLRTNNILLNHLTVKTSPLFKGKGWNAYYAHSFTLTAEKTTLQSEVKSKTSRSQRGLSCPQNPPPASCCGLSEVTSHLLARSLTCGPRTAWGGRLQEDTKQCAQRTGDPQACPACRRAKLRSQSDPNSPLPVRKGSGRGGCGRSPHQGCCFTAGTTAPTSQRCRESRTDEVVTARSAGPGSPERPWQETALPSCLPAVRSLRVPPALGSLGKGLAVGQEASPSRVPGPGPWGAQGQRWPLCSR